jgi:ribosome maturation factor RimP
MSSNDLEKLVVPELEPLGFECVKCEVVGSGRNPVVRLYIDKPGGVTVDDCSLVSRTVGLLLERQDPFPGRYMLEVSSPGSNRPLVTADHFRRFQGEQAKVQYRSGTDKITCTGQIRSCINDLLTMETVDGEVTVELSRIIKASLIGQDYKIDKKMKHARREARGKKRKGDER